MKTMKKSKVVGLFISLIFLMLVFILPINREVLLILNVGVLLLTLIRARLSIISLWCAITNYVMINVYAYDVTGVTYGVLGLTQISFIPMLRFMIIWNISLLFWATATNFTTCERKILNYDKYIPGKIFSLCCSCIAVLSILVAFPSIPFVFDSSNRFSALLPGNAWNHLAVIALIYVMPNIKRYKFVAGAYIFVAFWFLSHFERVDVLGLITVISFIYISKNLGKKNEWEKMIKIVVFGLISFIFLSFIGDSRVGASFSLSNILVKLVTQNTACDVGYMYNLAIEYIKEHEMLNGVTYLRYITKFIPGIDLNYLETTTILEKYYWVPGGSFILNEPLMNFGIIGVIVIPNVLIALVYLLLRKETKLRYIVYLFLLATPFRYLWYGIGFIETGIVLIIPFIYVIYKLMESRRNKNYDLC